MCPTPPTLLTLETFRDSHAGMMEVMLGDLEKAQQGFSPAASWGAGQVSSGAEGPQGWQDVGGLADVQASMQETLELPARYPKLIAK